MKANLNKFIAAGVLLTTGWMINPVNSFAGWDDNRRDRNSHRYERHDQYRGHDKHRDYNRHNDYRHGGHRRHVDFGLSINILPSDCFRITFKGSRFYYHEGTYYSRRGRDYVVVRPPSGVYVESIPYYYYPVMINGISYYTSDGIYYVYTRRGYQVVAPPVTVISAAPEAVIIDQDDQQIMTVNSSGLYTVNIPNQRGEYIPVVIKRSGNGFVGPQGEFYPEFPKVEQLMAMYVK